MKLLLIGGAVVAIAPPVIDEAAFIAAASDRGNERPIARKIRRKRKQLEVVFAREPVQTRSKKARNTLE